MFNPKSYMREYSRTRSAERKAAGLCTVCGEQAEAARTKCRGCLEKDVQRQKERQDELIAQGVCKMCARNKAEEGYLHCRPCLAKANRSTRKHAAKRRMEGRCHSCGIPCGESIRCNKCNAKGVARTSANRKQRLVEGRCRDCGEPAITTTRNLRGNDRAGYCHDCYLKMMSRSMLGSGKKWGVLLEKLDRCGWKCYYTGDDLVIGDNLSFDHLDPVSRFPERKHDPTNLEPCTWQINLMKRDLTKQEFLEMARKVAGNSKLRVT